MDIISKNGAKVQKNTNTLLFFFQKKTPKSSIRLLLILQALFSWQPL